MLSSCFLVKERGQNAIFFYNMLLFSHYSAIVQPMFSQCSSILHIISKTIDSLHLYVLSNTPYATTGQALPLVCEAVSNSCDIVSDSCDKQPVSYVAPSVILIAQ